MKKKPDVTITLSWDEFALLCGSVWLRTMREPSTQLSILQDKLYNKQKELV